MDWKSMTRPASLPITTDYFPDKRSLTDSYYVNPYTLLPEQLNMDLFVILSPPSCKLPVFTFIAFVCFRDCSRRAPLTVQQVYNELIFQRIAQGFQIVECDKPLDLFPENKTTNLAVGRGPFAAARKRGQSSRAQVKCEEVLSIGRIFHHLTLKGEEIQVNRIWPKCVTNRIRTLH